MKLALAGLATFALFLQSAADVAHQSALQKLEAGDAEGAEAAAREALAESLRFVPEQEIATRPERGILFEDMIREARKTYRARRARYFRTLGDALAAREKWRASRKAYRRAAGMVADPELFLLMADDEDLSPSQRLDYLLDAYLTPGADRDRLESVLLESGIFRSRNALKASLDRRRFPGLQAEHPELELIPAPFPTFQAETDAGTLAPVELYREGSVLFLYVPVDECAHCSEQLDGIAVPVTRARRSEIPIVVTAFVPEQQLSIARRIVRLLALEVGVGRLDGLPSSLELSPSGELRIVARGGMTQIRLPMSAEIRANEIRRHVEAVLSFLDAPGLPTEEEPEQASIPLVELEEQVSPQRTFYDWVDRLEALEAGPAPLDDLYERLRRLTLGMAREADDRELGFEMLEALGRLDGASAAKTQALTMLGADIGDRLLEEVRELEPDIVRTAPPGRGVFYVGVAGGEGRPRRVLLQRSFQERDGLQHFDFLLEDDGGELSLEWVAPVEGEPRGVEAVEAGAAFHYERGPDCDGLRLVADGEVIYESCAAIVIAGDVVEAHPALVDPVDDGPVYYRRDVVSGEREESRLERGLRLFEQGDMAAAAEAFEAAMSEIDPVAPYDASALVYNRARALEEMGERQEALALFRSLGDVPYQDLVDESAGRIEGAPR